MNRIQITTKSGDKGESGLANGQRLAKDASYFEVVGTLDELNSWLGLVAASLPSPFSSLQRQLHTVQETLFYIGAEVAASPTAKLPSKKVTALERWQQTLEKKLASNWHTKFLLPGGTVLGGQLDVARTVCRRCERVMVAHGRTIPISPTLLRYLNRLSDYLFLLRCYVNQELSYREIEFVAETPAATEKGD